MIVGIDPGTDRSAYCILHRNRVVESAILPNRDLLLWLRSSGLHQKTFAIEAIACYGMPVGADVFETCYWIGRFANEIERRGKPVSFVPRRDIKMLLCHSARAKDSNVRQALLDSFPATGGGKTPQVGTIKQPGPLYGVRSHVWSALAVAKYIDSKQRAGTMR